MSEPMPAPFAGADGADLITLNETARLIEQPVEDVFRAVICGRLPVVGRSASVRGPSRTVSWLRPSRRARRPIVTTGRPGSDRDPDLLTLSQAAAFLRVGPNELMAAVRLGEVPFYRRRGRIWFSRSELLDRMRRGQPWTRSHE